MNYSGSTFQNSCTTPAPGGTSNIVTAPLLVDVMQLATNSPCIGAGSYAKCAGVDMDGQAWLNPPCMGCDQYVTGTVTGGLNVAIQVPLTSVITGDVLDFTAQIQGLASGNLWNFGDGGTLTNTPDAVHAWNTRGDYPVTLTAFSDTWPGGITATITVHVMDQASYYVSANSATPAAPYTTWATAATNIQDAVNACVVFGGTVWVSNGVYSTGSAIPLDATLPNRLVVTNGIAVVSVNGPQYTTIAGQALQGPTNAVRCVWLDRGTTLSGFTCSNGFTAASGAVFKDRSGGGVYAGGATLTNCVVAGCSATNMGGGVYRGTLNNCVVSSCRAVTGGGVAWSLMTGGGINGNTATDGGGAWQGTLSNCTVSGNTAGGNGGGAWQGTLFNCTVNQNTATLGGGSYNSTLNNCSICANLAQTDGGGAYCGTLNDCGVSNNVAKNNGGGAWSNTVYNSFLCGNVANNNGGGGFYGAFYNSAVYKNEAIFGGGLFQATANNCTITGNKGDDGGGVYEGNSTNCIIYYNTAFYGPNFSGGNYFYPNAAYPSNSFGPSYYFWNDGGTIQYSCTTPDPADIGNITTEPMLAGVYHLTAGSPCIGKGTNAVCVGTDIDAQGWANAPCMGCDQYIAGGATGAVTIAIAAEGASVASGFAINYTAINQGAINKTVWDFGDGSALTNEPYALHAWNNTGDYTVTLTAFSDTYPAGISATSPVHVVSPPVFYVNLNNGAPVYPYATWATAATKIQDAVNACTVLGGTVLVSNGTYAAGSTVTPGASLANRLVVTNAIIVASVNGPHFTSIKGQASMRCAYLASRAQLSGFTLTNGATLGSGDTRKDQSGGGAYANGAVVSNSIIVGNTAQTRGGGMYRGLATQCTLMGNHATNTIYLGGGGIYGGAAFSCNIASNQGYSGGGTYRTVSSNCWICGNRGAGATFSDGGGVDGGKTIQCTLLCNSNVAVGGGASSVSEDGVTTTAFCMLDTCSIASNVAVTGGGGGAGGGCNGVSAHGCSISDNASVGGGGAQNSVLYNCLVDGNHAITLPGESSDAQGGGLLEGYVYNSAIINNVSDAMGGGAWGATLINCTVVGNSCGAEGGGVTDCTVSNCIVYFNTAGQWPMNSSGSDFSYSCTTPDPVGHNNTTNNPQLVSLYRLAAGSPCSHAGNWASVTGTDIDGKPWINPPAMGCDEPYGGSTGLMGISIQAESTNLATGYAAMFTAFIDGSPAQSIWLFGDGAGAINQAQVLHAWTAPGQYVVTLTACNDTFPTGVTASVTVNVSDAFIHYVDINSANPVPPYMSWATAAIQIQDAVDAVFAQGATVVVNDGVYNTGGRPVSGSVLTNRVFIDKPITVRSVNGPASTVIAGNGNSVRCVYLHANATLCGFDVNGGFINSGTSHEHFGAGIYCDYYAGMATNCWIRNCSGPSVAGGGSAGGIFNNCTISGNGIASYGGGSYASTLNNCTISGNSAGQGGGCYGGTLNNCTVANNTADEGGGLFECALNGCTVNNNIADNGGGGCAVSMTDCTISNNTATTSGGGIYADRFTPALITCCRITANTCADKNGVGDGGGLYDNDAVVSLWVQGSTINGNTANDSGGGVYGVGACMDSCVIRDNWAGNGGAGIGGGCWECALANCTVAANTATNTAGGTYGGTANNSIVYYNAAPRNSEYQGAAFLFSCTTPKPGGSGNILASTPGPIPWWPARWIATATRASRPWWWTWAPMNRRTVHPAYSGPTQSPPAQRRAARSRRPA
jgi:predicted outer membrane repeat protein